MSIFSNYTLIQTLKKTLLPIKIRSFTKDEKTEFLNKHPIYKKGIIVYKTAVSKTSKKYQLYVSHVDSDILISLSNSKFSTMSYYHFISNISSLKNEIHRLIEESTDRYCEQDLMLTSPDMNVGNVICVAHNYPTHCESWKINPPTNPILFSKLKSCISNPISKIFLPNHIKTLDYEGELAVMISKSCFQVSKENALNYVAGYTVTNDLTDRHLQLEANAGQYFLGKSLRLSLPLGPGLLIHEPGFDPGHFQIKTRVNRIVRQEAVVSEMLFSIPDIISYITRYTCLRPGDIICTGSPSGSGHVMDPPQYLKPNDVVSVSVLPIGSVRCQIEQVKVRDSTLADVETSDF